MYSLLIFVWLFDHALKWSGVYSRHSGFFSTAFSDVLLVLRTEHSRHRFFSTAFSHICSVLKWSGTCSRCQGSSSIAVSHIFCVVRAMGTYSRRQGTSLTTFSHASKNLGSLGTYLRFDESFQLLFQTSLEFYNGQERTPIKRVLFQQPYHTFFVFYGDLWHASTCMGSCLRPGCTSLVS